MRAQLGSIDFVEHDRVMSGYRDQDLSGRSDERKLRLDADRCSRRSNRRYREMQLHGDAGNIGAPRSEYPNSRIARSIVALMDPDQTRMFGRSCPEADVRAPMAPPGHLGNLGS